MKVVEPKGFLAGACALAATLVPERTSAAIIAVDSLNSAIDVQSPLPLAKTPFGAPPSNAIRSQLPGRSTDDASQGEESPDSSEACGGWATGILLGLFKPML